MKPIVAYWAFAVGPFSVAAQMVSFYLLFGYWNTASPVVDYMFFFLAGSLGGLVLIFFLNRPATRRGRWMVLAGFLLASPIALIMMVMGGLSGWLGVLLLPQAPWAFSAWLGSLGERLLATG